MMSLSKTSGLISPRGGNHEFITHDDYFGNTEENKSVSLLITMC